jgi:flavin-dependent dehydrogenase
MPRIAIIGGGPAGSSFALSLVRLGVDPKDLVILDKAVFPRPKLCGGGVTWRGTGLIEDVLGAKPKDGGHTRGLEFGSSLGGFHVREVGPQWVFDRAVLDEQLLRAAASVGVEVREGVSIGDVTKAPTGWRVHTKSGVETFDWVVGADGARGVVRRSASLPGGTVGRLLEAVFEPVDAKVDPSLLYFDFDPILDGIPGYAWIFPYPKPGASNLYKLGIMDGRGVVPGDALRAWTMDYAARHGFRLVDPKLQGWPEHYFSRRAKSHLPGLLLVGEAFGIDPLLGEGITPAIEQARYAARRLRTALDRGTDRVPFYELGYLATAEGRNLYYQGVLADRLYGRHPYRWMRVLFENQTIGEIAGSGNVAYGRITATSGALTLAFAREAIRRGFPSNAPVTRALPRAS